MKAASGLVLVALLLGCGTASSERVDQAAEFLESAGRADENFSSAFDAGVSVVVDYVNQAERLSELWERNKNKLCRTVHAALDEGYGRREIREAIAEMLEQEWGSLNAGTRGELRGQVDGC